MGPFPSPLIRSDRLELREFTSDDLGLAREVAAAGEGEGLNLASIRVAEKAGFRREGTLRRAGIEDDGLHDLALFSLLNDELP